MSLNNQEKFVNSFWVIILLVAVGIYFWVIPKNSIAEAYSKKKHYNLKKNIKILGCWFLDNSDFLCSSADFAVV